MAQPSAAIGNPQMIIPARNATPATRPKWADTAQRIGNAGMFGPELLTIEQCRVLIFCADQRGWLPLRRLERTSALQPDDVVVVPSLVEAGLLAHAAESKAIKITPIGAVLDSEARRLQRK